MDETDERGMETGLGQCGNDEGKETDNSKRKIRVYEKMSSRTDYRQRKRCDIEILIEELKERLELTIRRRRRR